MLMFKFDSSEKNLYQIYSDKKYSFSYIVKLNTLTPDKLLFTKNSNLEFPKLLDFQIRDINSKKSCHYHKDFHDSSIIYFKNFDIQNSFFIFPLYKCELFKCLSCDKIHNSKSKICCDLLKSPIEIIKAKLIKMIIYEENYHDCIILSRKMFLKLHFPDLTDMIIINE